MKPLPRPYHHGNLRQELLRVAEAALEARGVQELSLRELSRELGVSHASPQRHFPTKQDLIDALAIMGFERLSSVVGKAAEAQDNDFKARLTKAALAYVGFGLQHPALFALMFEAKRRPGMSAELKTALMASFSHVPKLLREGQEAGRLSLGMQIILLSHSVLLSMAWWGCLLRERSKGFLSQILCRRRCSMC